MAGGLLSDSGTFIGQRYLIGQVGQIGRVRQVGRRNRWVPAGASDSSDLSDLSDLSEIAPLHPYPIRRPQAAASRPAIQSKAPKTTR